MKLWAKALDPDFAHSERVAKLALELYDGLIAAGLVAPANGIDGRSILHIAALLHDVGKSQGKGGHHKSSFSLIQSHGAPIGWKPEDLQRAAVVARFHCGVLPSRRHKILRDLLPDEQKTTIQLAAVLRLANALDSAHDGHIRNVHVDAAITQAADRRRRIAGFRRKATSGLSSREAVIIAAEGYARDSSTAQAVAAERHLLETVLSRPILVKASKPLPKSFPEKRRRINA
jgi:exopolyphosphatase/pppGpp-phosphohydrolase